MSFFNSKDKPFYRLTIALKSSSINLQLCEVFNSNKIDVIHSVEETIYLENSQDPKLYTSHFVKKLNDILSQNIINIKRLIGKNEPEIVFLLYTPWFTSTITTILQKEIVTINNSYLSKKISKLQTSDNLYCLEKKIIQIKANGYTLSDYNNIKSDNIEIDVYISYISNQTKMMLSDLIRKFFYTCPISKFVTSPILHLDSIKRFMIKEDNLAFIHVDNEITEIGIIENDSLSFFITFPIGIHDFLKSINSIVKTYDYNLLYQKEILIKSPIQKEQFELVKSNWEKSIIESFNIFKGNIPKKILLKTNSKTKDFFETILNQSIKKEQNTVVSNHRIIDFDISLLKDIITYKTPTGEIELDSKLQVLI